MLTKCLLKFPNDNVKKSEFKINYSSVEANVQYNMDDVLYLYMALSVYI